VDIRRLPLSFLWLRTLLRNRHNVRVIHSDPDNPRLPTAAVDAVLIANTYHEFTHPKSIMDVVFQSLRNGGRLVIVDRGPESAPESANDESRRSEMQHHELPLAQVEGEIRQSGFEILNRQDRFIDGPGDAGLWWLLVARKP
jgi:SAM-dependent methyltransferase